MTTKGAFLIMILCTSLITRTYGQDSLKIITDLNTLRTRPSQLETRNYLSRNWQTGNIYLFNEDVILNQQIRYDLDNGLIEIKTQKDIKILEVFRVRRFDWVGDTNQKSLFTNCASYQYITWLEGFFRILTEGKISLLERTQMVVESDHSIGTQDVEMFVKNDRPDELESKLYIANGNLVYDLGRKKEILTYFGDKSSQVEAYSKEHRYNFRNQKDLIQIIEHYNSLP